MYRYLFWSTYTMSLIKHTCTIHKISYFYQAQSLTEERMDGERTKHGAQLHGVLLNNHLSVKLNSLSQWWGIQMYMPLFILSFPALQLLQFDAVQELAAILKFRRYFMYLQLYILTNIGQCISIIYCIHCIHVPTYYLCPCMLLYAHTFPLVIWWNYCVQIKFSIPFHTGTHGHAQACVGMQGSMGLYEYLSKIHYNL